MYLRSRSCVNKSIVLTRNYHYCIQHYISSRIDIILKYIVLVPTVLEPATQVPHPTACVSDALANL